MVDLPVPGNQPHINHSFQQSLVVHLYFFSAMAALFCYGW
jgi:hypothetical protein